MILEPEELFDERGEVSQYRAIFQGDVFRDVPLSDFDHEPMTVLIVTHPCSMRRGEDLVERLQVAPIEACQKHRDWTNLFREMPLFDLHEDGKPNCAKFIESTSAKSSELILSKRIASLTHQGIYALQRQLILYQTRVDVSHIDLRRQMNPVLQEMELQREWLEYAFGDELSAGDQDGEIQRETEAFQTWLTEVGRHKLKNEACYADLRRSLRGKWVES
jgi:hypothetical protein